MYTKNSHKITVHFFFKKSKLHCMIPLCLKWLCVCLYKLCLESRSGRRHRGSVNCGHSRNRDGRVRPVSYFYFIRFWVVWFFFFKELPFITITILKTLHVLKMYTLKCSKKKKSISVLKFSNNVYTHAKVYVRMECILFLFCN